MTWPSLLHDGRAPRSGILAICILAHLGLGWWLMHPPQRRIDDLIARGQPVGQTELRALIDRERRQGCR